MRQEHENQAQDRALARLLDMLEAPDPAPGLATRIVARMPRPRPLWWPFQALWQPLGGLAAAMLLGVVVGITLPAPLAAEPDEAAPWGVPEWAEPSL